MSDNLVFFSTEGYYFYIETSSPRRPGDRARLISPPLQGQYRQCINFYYHMYGPHVNILNVYLRRGNTTLGNPVWKRTGSQGNQWKLGQYQIPGGQTTQTVTNVSLLLKCYKGIYVVSSCIDI